MKYSNFSPNATVKALVSIYYSEYFGDRRHTIPAHKQGTLIGKAWIWSGAKPRRYFLVNFRDGDGPKPVDPEKLELVG